MVGPPSPCPSPPRRGIPFPRAGERIPRKKISRIEPLNVAADVSRRTDLLSRQRISADSRRRLRRFMGREHLQKSGRFAPVEPKAKKSIVDRYFPFWCHRAPFKTNSYVRSTGN